MVLSCIIIDDEPLALALVESYVLKTPYLKLMGKYSSAIAASAEILTSPPDVLFLDIQMAELTGIEFAKLVTEKTRIIFTTAFQQYALESYKVNALDYLLKPFNYTEFLVAANKALKWYQRTDTAPIQNTTTPKPDSIFVKSNYQLVQIELKNILYIEGLKDYLKIYQDGIESPVITHITMKAMDDMLPDDQFIRVHRSFIVQKAKIKIIDRNRIVFGKTHIPISDSYKKEFEGFLDGKLF